MILIGHTGDIYSERGGFLVRTFHKHSYILWLSPTFCGIILLVLCWGFLFMAALHLSILLLGLCDPLLQSQYYPSIVDCLLDELGQFCFLQLGQTFPIEPVQALFTVGNHVFMIF